MPRGRRFVSPSERQRELAAKPWALRQGVRGPRYFRTLLGAQGWADQNWPEGTADITGPSGSFQRLNGNWYSAGEIELEQAEEGKSGPPYWVEL